MAADALRAWVFNAAVRAHADLIERRSITTLSVHIVAVLRRRGVAQANESVDIGKQCVRAACQLLIVRFDSLEWNSRDFDRRPVEVSATQPLK